jgi:hypothetical protein
VLGAVNYNVDGAGDGAAPLRDPGYQITATVLYACVRDMGLRRRRRGTHAETLTDQYAIEF